MDTSPGNQIFKGIREQRQARQKGGSQVLQMTSVTDGDEKKWTGYLRRHGCSVIQVDLVSLRSLRAS